MPPQTLANGMRRLGLAAAWFCAVLAFAVFTVLLFADHIPLSQAAQAAMPLATFALFGGFGAAMTRFLAS